MSSTHLTVSAVYGPDMELTIESHRHKHQEHVRSTDFPYKLHTGCSYGHCAINFETGRRIVWVKHAKWADSLYLLYIPAVRASFRNTELFQACFLIFIKAPCNSSLFCIKLRSI